MIKMIKIILMKNNNCVVPFTEVSRQSIKHCVIDMLHFGLNGLELSDTIINLI